MALGTGLTRSVPVRPSAYPAPDLRGEAEGIPSRCILVFGTKRPMQADRAWETPSKSTRDLTPCQRSGSSAVISDGNRDGNDGTRQRPDATLNSHLLPARPA
jgi:hypothetical protein